MAISYGHAEIVNVLLNAGANVNAKNNIGYTALEVAIRKGHTEIVNALLKAGADVNAKDSFGMTMLELAKMYGHTEVVKTLKPFSPTKSTGCMTLIIETVAMITAIVFAVGYFY